MIDVMKRLAELDSKNPTIVKENQQVEECGIMPEMGMGMPMDKPAMPASINMTAGSGDELSDMLATIMQLAGRKAPGAEEPMAAEPVVALTAEPEMTGGDEMRSMMDKLNPMDGDDQGGDDVSAAHGDIDNDGDHDMDDHNAEKDEEETDEGQYDNSPADPRKPPPFGANDFAHQENQQGAGNTRSGQSRQDNMPTATMEQQLMADYKKFVAETQVDEISTALVNKVHNARQQNAQQAHADDYADFSARAAAKSAETGVSPMQVRISGDRPAAHAATAASKKLDRNKQLSANKPNSNYANDQAEKTSFMQKVGQSRKY